MSAVSGTVNTNIKTENIGFRMDEDPDVEKQNGGLDGSRTPPEVRLDKSEESRAEVVKMATTNSSDCAGNELKEGTNGRSQYHSIQRLLSPSAGTGSQQQPAMNGAVSGSQQSTMGGVAARYPTTTSGSAATSLMSELIAGLNESTVEKSATVRPLEFLKEPIQEKLQKVDVMESTIKGQRSIGRMTRKGWETDVNEKVKNGAGVNGTTDRSVDVSTNDFLDSMEDIDEASMKSPLTDLSNSFSEEEEEDLSDAEETTVLNGIRRHERFQREAEEEEEDMEMEEQEKSCGRGVTVGDVEVTSYLEDGASGFSDSGSYGDSVEAKRARMESIVTNMKRSPSSTSNEIAQAERLRVVDPRRPKRKQYIPKQHDSCRSTQVIELEPEMAAKKIRTSDKEELQQELCRMQERLADMRERYFHIFGDAAFDKRNEEDDEEDVEEEEEGEETIEAKRGKQGTGRTKTMFSNGTVYPERRSPFCADTPTELKHLAGLLKAEISNTVGTLVDEIVKNFLNRNRGLSKDSITPFSWRGSDSMAKNAEKVSSINDKTNEDRISVEQKEEVSSPQTDTKPLLLPPPFFPQNPVHSSPQSSASLVLPQPVRPHPATMLADFSKVGAGAFSHLLPFSAQSKPLKSSKLAEKFMSPLFDSSHHIHRSPMPTIFPHPFFHHPPVMAAAAAAAVAAGMFAKEPEQTEALPLIVNTPTKKKRTKVTDTRLSPRAARAILQENGQLQQRHQQQQYPTAAHSLAEEATLKQNPPSSSQTTMDRPNSNETTDHESFFAAFHPQFPHNSHHHQSHPHHHHMPHHHHSLLPVTLPTSVAIPNPSLRHSDIMQAIYGHRKHHQHHQSQHLLELDLPSAASASSSSPRSASQQQQRGFPGSGGFDRARALPGHVRSASSSPEVGQTSSDGFSGSIMTKADSMDNYDGSIYDDQAMTSTLTPMHLRKAKLMFFYVRYPSSAILKVFFPDVKFNKNNTAQLIKWFSNFREFYYIQMEKYARQALAEGVKSATDLVVSSDSELYRVLILHYNRNNRIEVPDHFRQTVQATLREFFKSLQGEKDHEPSWKKSIYKIIAHLDDTVPEYFKSANWMEQLADG